MAISALRTLVAFFILVGVAFVGAGCGDNPVAATGNHFEARGLVLQQHGTDILTLDSGKVTGAINLVAGEATEAISLLFIEEDGSRGIPDGSDTERSFQWTIADTTIATLKQESREGKWQFHLEGKKRGETTVVLKLMHGDHPDFTSVPIKIEVMEKPSGLVLEMDGTEVVRVVGTQATGAIDVPAGTESDRIEVFFLNQDGTLFQPEGGNHIPNLTIANTDVARIIQNQGNPWSFRIEGVSSGTTTLRIRLQHQTHDDFVSPEILITTS